MWAWIERWWEGILSLTMTGAVGVLYRYMTKKYKDQRVDQMAIRKGMQALLRDRIIQAYNYHMGRGYCPIYERDGVQGLYEEYHALGGNGVIERLMEELHALPTERRENPHEKGA